MPLFDNLGYGGEKIAVIFDIGASFTKCGFAGENSPRRIVPTPIRRPKTNQLVNVRHIKDTEELYGTLVDFIHALYFRHVLVNPKERRVVIVESVLTSSLFRETLAKVLFKHYEVPSVLFAPSHLMALLTLGVPSALVLDSGYTETVVLPVYEGVPIIKCCQSLPLAAKAIHNYMDAQLKESATVKFGQEDKPLSSLKESLEENILEDIKVRCCFVTKLSRAKQIQACHMSQEGAEMPEPPPSVDYPLNGNEIISLPGKIREHSCEVLFEQDNDEQSVATLVLDSILQCPLDIRKNMAENILLIGGTSMLPGFKHRLLSELHDLLDKPKYTQLALKTFKFHTAPAKENYTAWLGGSIFGALEILGSRSVSRDQYNANHVLPDWCALTEFEEKEDRSALLSRKDAPKETSLAKKPIAEESG